VPELPMELYNFRVKNQGGCIVETCWADLEIKTNEENFVFFDHFKPG
jgi:hypothetical protein